MSACKHLHTGILHKNSLESICLTMGCYNEMAGKVATEASQLDMPDVFCGMYLMTNSRNCTCQQSSVNCRDQWVRKIESLQNMSEGMHEFHMHKGSIALQQWLAEC